MYRFRSLFLLYPIMFALLLPLMSAAQTERKITPVEVDDKKPEQPILHYFDEHGEPLEEPVLFLATLDTVTAPRSAPVYPLLHGIDVGVNIFDVLAKTFGQKYASLDAWASLSLHNWLFPTVELGVGFGKTTPDGMNFTYKALPSFYCKVGLDYNFLYKSNSDYKATLGLRGGYSSFRYDVTDVTISSDYWGETNVFDLPRQKASAFYGELVAGIRVMLFKNFSMGWTGRYHFMFSKKKGANSDPWFIPGYGTNSSLSVTLSLIYHIPLSGKKEDFKGIDTKIK